jgi:IS30 family transposase
MADGGLSARTVRLAGHGAEAVRDAIAATITTLPEHLRRSLTWDQCAEMAQHAQLRIDTGIPVFFCGPNQEKVAA